MSARSLLESADFWGHMAVIAGEDGDEAMAGTYAARAAEDRAQALIEEIAESESERGMETEVEA